MKKTIKKKVNKTILKKKKQLPPNKEWWFINGLEGPSLVLGVGFDYDAMILFDSDKQNVLIRYRKSTTEGEPNYPYPVIEELVVPFDKIKMLLPP